MRRLDGATYQSPSGGRRGTRTVDSGRRSMSANPVSTNVTPRRIERRSGSSTARSDPGEPEEVVSQAYVTVFGAPPCSVTINVLELGLLRRARRAALVLLVCWALALVSVFIVLAHFILVPGFLAGGLVLAYVRFRTARLVTRVHGVCPRCGIEQDFDPPSWGRTVGCPRCKNQLTLTGLDDSPDVTVGSPPV